MPARDKYHNAVKHSLIKDGWTITHDPYLLRLGNRDMFVDLGAEQFFAAEKVGRKIAVEVKSFVRPSEIVDLRDALGQFILYQDVLNRVDPERVLYLAIHDAIFDNLFDEPIGKMLLENKRVQLMVFEPEQEVIIQWIP